MFGSKVLEMAKLGIQLWKSSGKKTKHVSIIMFIG